MKKDKTFFSMVGTMLKIGAIGFGGGTALIPVIEDEIVEKKKRMKEEQFNNEVMIASITPGALPVEIAAGIGLETAGNRGMVAMSAAMAFPGAFLTLFFLIFVTGAKTGIKTQIGYMAAGISGFIIFTLLSYTDGTIKEAKNKKERLLYLFIVLAVFWLSGEKNIYQLLGIEKTPLFGLSTIQILGTAFFIILYTRGRFRDVKRTIPAVIVAGLYFLSAGKAQIFPEMIEKTVLCVMFGMAAVGAFASVRENQVRKAFPAGKLGRAALGWFLWIFVLSLPALVLFPGTFSFMGTGILSSVLSFGGGDAYLSVAQGLFVDSGMVSRYDFYGNIVSVANVLPGSILCKTLTGIGYVRGYQFHQSVGEGVTLAVCAFACSVAASGMIYVLVKMVYEKYENLRLFAAVKHFIRPIISGLLLNVALSLYLSGVLSQAEGRTATGVLTGMTALIVLMGIWAEKRTHIHLVWKILFSAGLSFVICNLLAGSL